MSEYALAAAARGISTVEMAELGYRRACDRYHDAILNAYDVEVVRAARFDWRRSKAILAAKRWERDSVYLTTG